jgi:hypothetical protein
MPGVSRAGASWRTLEPQNPEPQNSEPQNPEPRTSEPQNRQASYAQTFHSPVCRAIWAESDNGCYVNQRLREPRKSGPNALQSLAPNGRPSALRSVRCVTRSNPASGVYARLDEPDAYGVWRRELRGAVSRDAVGGQRRVFADVFLDSACLLSLRVFSCPRRPDRVSASSACPLRRVIAPASRPRDPASWSRR